nr:endo-1,6-beta-d-glucanase bgn16.3 [Quercus suber]
MLRVALQVVALTTGALAQSVSDFGVSGGAGPKGGIGDRDHPVLRARSIITDGIIQLSHLDVTARQLAESSPPRLNFVNATSCNARRTVIVDNSAKGARQEMLGFGHSWTDSAVEVFNQVEPDVLDQIMQDLFGQDGNNMGFMRHTMGSSDLSGRQYSFDDNGPSFNEGEPDMDLQNFDLGPDGRAMASMIARMGDYKGDVFLFGSPWSYPGWMKQNGLFIAPNLLNGYNILNNSFDGQYIPQAINYFTKYVDAYKSHGVTVNGITLENEPLNYQGGYPCMYLDADDAAALVTNGLGDAMKERGVKIIAYDHNTDQKDIGASGWHCYASPANYSVLDDFHYAFPEVPQFLTECSSYLPYDFSLYLAQNFLVTTQHGSSGGAFWVMATDPDFGPHSPYGGCAGCLGAIVVNSTTTYTKTHDYYMLGQFSRFIRRGSRNYRVLQGIEGTNVDQQFLIIAVQNPDESWALVFLNNIGSDQDVKLSFTSHPGQFWTGTIPNLAVVTWLLPSDHVLAQNGTLGSTTYSTATVPYPGGNSTATGLTGSGTGTGTGFPTCPATTSMSAMSSSTSTGPTLLPVPHTDHTISSAAGDVPTVSVTDAPTPSTSQLPATSTAHIPWWGGPPGPPQSGPMHTSESWPEGPPDYGSLPISDTWPKEVPPFQWGGHGPP